MAQVRWTQQAANDLEAITDFIALDSPHYASLFAMDVFASVERLQAFPRLGRIVPELREPDIREIILGDVLSEIDVQTAAGIVTSVITTRSVKDLELAVGSEVIAFVKSTEVSIAKL